MIRRRYCLATAGCAALLLMSWHHYAFAQGSGDFSDKFDAVTAAPASHHVVFENSFIRVLQVTLPPAGSAEPMHSHRWPSLFLGYDTGGTTAHLRYRTPDGKIRDIPAETEATHKGEWGASWLEPETLHSIEVVSDAVPGPGSVPGWLRVEVKFAPG